MTTRNTLLMLAAFGCSEFSIEDQDDIVTNPLTVEESFLHQTEPRVDVLLVIDNTASMASEHQMLNEGLPLLVDSLQNNAISWHLGTISTDVTSRTDSILLGDPWVLTSTMENPEQHLEQMIDVGTNGKQPEAGIAAALSALTPTLRTGANRGFRRPSAALHVVIISDGDDESDEILGPDSSQMFLDFLDEESADNSEDSHLSALVGPSPNGCSGASGTALAGQKYLEIAESTQGFTDSICDIDFTTLGDWIAETSQPANPFFELQAKPNPASIRVQVNEARWDSGWTLISGDTAIQFTVAPPPGAEIQVRYEVLSS